MRASLVITTFNRDHLLKPCLKSIADQALPDLEVIIVNDGNPCDTESIAEEFGARYVFTGFRNLEGGEYWRAPAPAINTGAKKARGEILILSCAEIFHLDNCLERLCEPLFADPSALSIPEGLDATARYSDELARSGDRENRFLKDCKRLNTRLPFLMAMWKSSFLDIGGYDEDFAKGYAFDDDDIVDRLQDYGCHYVETKAQCIHLFHSRVIKTKRIPWRFEHNKQLYHERKGIIERNVGREWGVADVESELSDQLDSV